jgi:hypothetical protein
MTGSGHHTRINSGVLAAAEKRTLIWIAERLPRWINSDHLTLLALASMAAAGAAFWAARFWLPALGVVIAALVLNWFGDSLDGTVARVRKHERPRYGFYVDHVLDIVGIKDPQAQEERGPDGELAPDRHEVVPRRRQRTVGDRFIRG